MRALLSIVLATCVGHAGRAARAVPSPPEAPLAGLQPVPYPEFDSERGIQWSSTREEYEAARADQRFVMEQFPYPSDGLTVGAYLYRPARAAAVWGAFTDLEPLLAPGSPQALHAPLIWPDLEQNRAAIVELRSAIRWVDRIDTPVLIMHGSADEDIPLEQSQRLDAELTRRGKTHRLTVFDGQPHRIGGRGKERDAAAVAWFRRFGASQKTGG